MFFDSIKMLRFGETKVSKEEFYGTNQNERKRKKKIQNEILGS